MAYALVTGAAGFIGSRLTELLLKRGRDVLAVDCFLPDLYPAEIKINRWNSLNGSATAKLEKLEFDLRNKDMTILRNYEIDSIFNLAAMPGLVDDWSKFQPYYDCNLIALNNLLEFVKSSPVKSFIQASTSSVYGISATGDEGEKTAPVSPYGVSKLAAEKLLLAYGQWHGVPGRILRYFSIYGPNQRPDMAYSKIIRCLVEGKSFTIHGDGNQIRSNTFIDDAVNATLLVEEKVTEQVTLNICGDETVSLNDVIEILENISGKTLLKKWTKNRVGDQRQTAGINELAKQILGWRCTTDIRTGLTLQLNSFLQSAESSRDS